MKKLILALMVIFAAVTMQAGDWGYQDLYNATSYTFSFDTIESFYTLTYDIGNGKKIPEYVYFTHFITPTTADSVNFSYRLDYSNDQNKWYNYGYIDTVTLTETQAKAGLEINGCLPIVPYAFRYFRLLLQNNLVDTFTVRIQRSYETE